MSRRAFGIGALAAPAAAQQAATKYTGALDGFESKVDAASFDPVLWTRKRYEAMPLKMTFRAENRRQAEA